MVNHKNGIKNDNKVENLEWVTQSENEIHRFHVLGVGLGEKNHNAKLRTINIPVIRKLLAQKKLTHGEIGKIFGVNHQTISKIKNKRLWAHIN